MHTLTLREARALRRLTRRAEVLITQPISTGYRGLGLGLEELRPLLPDAARVVTWAPLYWDALFPFAVTVHGDGRRPLPAPLITHHDLRLLCAGRRGYDERQTLELFHRPQLSDEGVNHVLRGCAARLEAREQPCDVQMLPFISSAAHEPHAFHSFNHPRLFVLDEVARRIHGELGLTYLADPEARGEPLGHLRLPLEAAVLRARSMQGESRSHWIVQGTAHHPHEIAPVHLAWYAAHPDVLERGLDEHHDRMAALGLAD